jgi:Primase C terminal 2 (PriCT-2)
MSTSKGHDPAQDHVYTYIDGTKLTKKEFMSRFAADAPVGLQHCIWYAEHLLVQGFKMKPKSICFARYARLCIALVGARLALCPSVSLHGLSVAHDVAHRWPALIDAIAYYLDIDPEEAFNRCQKWITANALPDVLLESDILGASVKEAQRLVVPSASIKPPPVNEINVGLIMSALKALPDAYADDYQKWFRVACAIHDFDSGEIGLALFTEFSSRCPEKADATDFEAFWSTLGGYSGKKITLGSLIHWAKEAGWKQPRGWDWAPRG